MSRLDKHNLYELDILKHVEETPRLNNRMAARKLGVSVKLAHQLLKRMVSKGLLHVKEVHSRRWDYFLTPRGVAEKTRLTLEFLDFSMHFYREARRRSSQLCRDLAEAGKSRIAFLGAGDLAEIVYLGVQEWGLDLVAVYDDNDQATFMNRTVRPIRDMSSDGSDAIIVCMYNAGQPMGKQYLPEAVPREEKMTWVF
ncbi:MAG: winged helix-turn-helix domain-containing protein [Candidatus Pacebacteria bacterium]|nr:winged helix-turn-helix domain-containing protein [Candidatus Paceibacterota bacterium]